MSWLSVIHFASAFVALALVIYSFFVYGRKVPRIGRISALFGVLIVILSGIITIYIRIFSGSFSRGKTDWSPVSVSANDFVLPMVLVATAIVFVWVQLRLATRNFTLWPNRTSLATSRENVVLRSFLVFIVVLVAAVIQIALLGLIYEWFYFYNPIFVVLFVGYVPLALLVVIALFVTALLRR